MSNHEPDCRRRSQSPAERLLTASARLCAAIVFKVVDLATVGLIAIGRTGESSADETAPFALDLEGQATDPQAVGFTGDSPLCHYLECGSNDVQKGWSHSDVQLASTLVAIVLALYVAAPVMAETANVALPVGSATAGDTGASGSEINRGSPDGIKSAQVGSAVTRTLNVDGLPRTYTLNLPPGYRRRPAMPLVIALHGGGGNAATFASSTQLTTKANAERFAVVYPNGITGAHGLQTWNGGGCCGKAVTEQVDDVNFIRQLIIEVSANYNIDTRRVYVTGHSNGGIMAHRLACELSDRIAAIAANAAALMVETCSPDRPVPVLHMHSKLDENVPVSGGTGIGISGVDFPSLKTTIKRWLAADDCKTKPLVKVNPGQFTRRIWSKCSADVTVVMLLTDDGGHSWPGSTGDGNPSTAISANDELWEFFEQFSLP